MVSEHNCKKRSVRSKQDNILNSFRINLFIVCSNDTYKMIIYVYPRMLLHTLDGQMSNQPIKVAGKYNSIFRTLIDNVMMFNLNMTIESETT